MHQSTDVVNIIVSFVLNYLLKPLLDVFNCSGDVWIGMYYDGAWTFTNGTTVPSNFTPTGGSTNNCGTLKGDQVVDHPCIDSKPYICMAEGI